MSCQRSICDGWQCCVGVQPHGFVLFEIVRRLLASLHECIDLACNYQSIVLFLRRTSWKKKKYEYPGEAVTVSYDLKRCIHAAACVHGLPEVFDPNKKPWVSPDEASAADLQAVILQCPTGALKYTMANGDTESVPDENTVDVAPDGPLFIRGNVEISASDGTVMLKDTRVALCRCGASENKPLCDGKHAKAGFADPATDFENPKMRPVGEDASAVMTIRLAENGPLLVEGVHTVFLAGRATKVEGEKCALCRCGASKNKPFCDGAHKAIGFQG